MLALVCHPHDPNTASYTNKTNPQALYAYIVTTLNFDQMIFLNRFHLYVMWNLKTLVIVKQTFIRQYLHANELWYFDRVSSLIASLGGHFIVYFPLWHLLVVKRVFYVAKKKV